jgi:hypothetical protein
MPFDSTTIKDRVSLIECVSNTIVTFDRASNATDNASFEKSAACDDLVEIFREALIDFDLPPFYFWMDICAANGYAYTHLDPKTGKTTKVEGDKPHNTLKNVASQIKKYYENNKNIDVASYTELRKANAPGPKTEWDKAMAALSKLSPEEIEILRTALNKKAES